MRDWGRRLIEDPGACERVVGHISQLPPMRPRIKSMVAGLGARSPARDRTIDPAGRRERLCPGESGAACVTRLHPMRAIHRAELAIGACKSPDCRRPNLYLYIRTQSR